MIGCEHGVRTVWAVLALAAVDACGTGGAPDPVDGVPLLIEVTGDDYYWHVRYAGPDGELHTSDDVEDLTDLHVPAATPVRVRLLSQDYVYVLAVPEFGLKQVAVPDLSFDLDFEIEAPGTYRLAGQQLCGFRHESLNGDLFVHTSAEFRTWLNAGGTH